VAKVILKDPAVESLSSFIGIDGTNTTLNSGRIQINLKPLAERKISASDVIRRLQPELAKVTGITLYMQPVQDLTVDDRVSRTQFQYTLEDPNADELNSFAPKMLAKLQKLPELSDVASDQQNAGLQAKLVFDRDTASRLGITPSTIDQTLYDAYGQREVSTMFTQLNQYHVVLEVKPGSIRGRSDLSDLYIRSGMAGAPARRGLAGGRRPRVRFRTVEHGHQRAARRRRPDLGRRRPGEPQPAARPLRRCNRARRNRPPHFPTAARCRSAPSRNVRRPRFPSRSTIRASFRWSRSRSIWRPTLRWATRSNAVNKVKDELGMPPAFRARFRERRGVQNRWPMSRC
jgi:multidrug efflux pump